MEKSTKFKGAKTVAYILTPKKTLKKKHAKIVNSRTTKNAFNCTIA